jgi:hypothetical protein
LKKMSRFGKKGGMPNDMMARLGGRR